jgi:hypothetical protein
VPRSNQAVAAIVAFTAQDRDLRRPLRGSANELLTNVRHAGSSRFHELKAGDSVVLRGHPVDLAHLGSGENLHANSGLETGIKVKSSATQIYGMPIKASSRR